MKEWIDLAVMGIGAGAKGTVVGLINKFLPGLEVGSDIAAVVAGGLLYKFGGRVHPLVRKLGAGVLISAIGQLSEGFIGGIIPEAGGSSNPSSNPNPARTTNSLAAMAEAEARRTVKTGVMIA